MRVSRLQPPTGVWLLVFKNTNQVIKDSLHVILGSSIVQQYIHCKLVSVSQLTDAVPSKIGADIPSGCARPETSIPLSQGCFHRNNTLVTLHLTGEFRIKSSFHFTSISLHSSTLYFFTSNVVLETCFFFPVMTQQPRLSPEAKVLLGGNDR